MFGGVDTSSLTVAPLDTSAVSHVAAKYYPQIDDLDIALGVLVQKMKDGTKNSQNLKTFCIHFLTTLTRIHSHDVNTKDAIVRLASPACQNDEAIDIVQVYMDPLDCRLLYQITSALKDEHLKIAWDNYCQRSKQACCTTLEQCHKVAIRPHQSSPSGITLGMQTKISPPDFTIQKITDLQDLLTAAIGLVEIVFLGFACSAVALFFTVNRARLPILIRLLSCHQKALLDFSIVIVFVPGEFFYDVARDQEYPCPKVGTVTNTNLTSNQYIAENVVIVYEVPKRSKLFLAIKNCMHGIIYIPCHGILYNAMVQYTMPCMHYTMLLYTIYHAMVYSIKTIGRRNVA